MLYKAPEVLLLDNLSTFFGVWPCRSGFMGLHLACIADSGHCFAG